MVKTFLDDQTDQSIQPLEEQKNKKFKWVDVFLYLLLAIIIAVGILSWQYPDFGNNFSIENLIAGDYTNASFWVAIGATMLACFLGALIPMPIPYMVSVATYSAAWVAGGTIHWLEIIGIILFASIANTIGDFLDYIIGRGAEMATKKDDPELSNRWGRIVLYEPKAIPWLVILFGATPLPDSLLLVPLGYVKYPMKNTLVMMFIGKILMMGSTAIAGIFGINAILNLVSGEGSWVMGVILLFLMWVIIFLMVKIKPPEKKVEDPN